MTALEVLLLVASFYYSTTSSNKTNELFKKATRTWSANKDFFGNISTILYMSGSSRKLCEDFFFVVHNKKSVHGIIMVYEMYEKSHEDGYFW